jgi:molybdopterin-containing oxidoreductase family membrane subunit
MVLLLVIPLRSLYKLESYVTMRHIQNMSKIMLATGLVVLYGYLVELFFAAYSGTELEMTLIDQRLFGPYGWSFWALIFCNGLVPQILWLKSMRNNLLVVWLVSLVISVGMWLERFVIVIGSLSRDYLPSSWDTFVPTFWDFALYAGTIGLFFSLTFLFIRFLPMINIFEIQMLKHEEE